MDDINMPVRDEYGSQPPLELVRLWHDYGYWYDREKQWRKNVRVRPYQYLIHNMTILLIACAVEEYLVSSIDLGSARTKKAMNLLFSLCLTKRISSSTQFVLHHRIVSFILSSLRSLLRQLVPALIYPIHPQGQSKVSKT